MRRAAVIFAVLVVVLAAGRAVAQSPAPACLTVRVPIVVDLSDTAHVDLIAHERAAVDRGAPRLLHVDRPDADAHRKASLRGHPTRPGFDRDEYPPAVAAEGGAGADVDYVPRAENRSGGAVLRAALAPFCDGQAFIVEKGRP
jgi:hypothetical protein